MSDGLVAATCTDTFLYYTSPGVGIRKKKVILRKPRCVGLANLQKLPDYEGRLDRRNAARSDEENMCVSFVPIFCCDESLSHAGGGQSW